MSAVTAVRKTGSAVVHAAAQSGTWASAPLFESTACGRKIAADGTWNEVSAEAIARILANHAPEIRFCARCAAQSPDGSVWRIITGESESLPPASAPEDVHAEALAEDAQRTDDAWLIAATGEAHLIFLIRGVVRADTGARIVQARTVCGITATGETSADRPPFPSLCLDCVDHDSQNGASLPDPEHEPSAPEVRPDTPWREGDPAPRLIVADYGRLGWGEDAGPRHVVREVRGVDSDHGYDVGTLQQDDRDGTGTQGAADTLCGVVAYGVMYWPAQGPAVDCQACILSDDVRPADLAEYVTPDEVTAPMPEDLVPTVWDAVCEYCKRYRRPCGRHEVPNGPEDVCRHCEQSVWQDSHGSWIDATDGDGCDSPSGVHEVTSGHAPVGGPVPIAVTVTSAMLGSDAGPHLWELYRNTVVDASAQDEIAAAYDALPLRSTERIVALAWQAFEEETLSQARVLRAHKVHYNVVTTDPYANAGELFADLRRTGTIRVLSTRVTGGHPILPNHVNDAFRAVHDILGHAATGRGFDRHGEEAAFQAHSVLYSPLARLALATETRGQNASMLRAGGVFPPERIAVLPEWARALDALQWRDAWNRAPYADAARDHATQGLGRWGS